MNETEFKKLRFKFIQECWKLNRCLKIQDQERTKIYDKNSKELNHIFLGDILLSPKKEYYTLINHNELLRYSIENDDLTEIKYDIDYKEHENHEENLKQAVTICKNLCLTIQNKLRVKPIAYYSGGGGCHIHFLLKIPNDLFEIKLNGMTHKNYDEKLYKEMSQERKKFKKKIYQYLNLKPHVMKYIDTKNSFSAETLLTLEGAKKREQGKKYKTRIQFNYDIDVIMKFIKSDYSPFIDFDFFKPQEMPKEILKDILNFDVKAFKEEKQQKREQSINKVKKSSQNQSRIYNDINVDDDTYKEHYNKLIELKNKNKALFTECLSFCVVKLKERKNKQSFNTFSYYILKLLIYLQYNDNEIKIIYSQLIMSRLSLNLDKIEIENKFNTQYLEAKKYMQNETNFKFNYIYNSNQLVFSAKGLMLSVEYRFNKKINSIN